MEFKVTDKKRTIIIDDESYGVWFKGLKDQLNDVLTASSNTACFEIPTSSEVNNCVYISANEEYIVKNIKKSPPCCISYCAFVNHLNSFDDTEISDLFLNEEVIQLLVDRKKELIKEFEFLKGKEIGYEIYLHYPSVTYKFETGYIPTYKAKKHVEGNNDGLFDYYADLDDEEETEEDRLDREAYEKEMAEKLAKIESFAKDLCGDKRLSLTKNKDQRNALAKLFFKERLDSSWSEWDIDRMVVRAINIYELEMLPNQVADLVKQNKTPKQISEELGISLAKAKKVISVIAE